MTTTRRNTPSAPGLPRKLLGCSRGAAAVEFALLLPVLFLILVQIVDFGLAFRERIQLEAAARAGLSYALASPIDTASIQDAATNATGLPAADLTVTVTEFCECPNGGAIACGSGCTGSPEAVYIQVDVQKTFNPLLPHDLLSDFYTLTGTAIGRVN